nr:AsmA-like C-terminal region-containing protein [Caldimonas sp.]
GAFTYDKRPKVPLLAGRLGGSRLVLADLGPAVGTPPPGSGAAKAAAANDGRVIPDKRFDLPSLHAMTANVVVDIGTFDPGTDILEPLHPARAHLLLADGVLTIADFVGVTAQGRMEGYLQLDARRDHSALWTADLRLLGVDLAQWLRLKRSGNAPPYLSGKLDALVKVKGSGRSTAEILGTLAGDLRMHLRGAAVSHVAVEAGGIDVAQALGVMVKGDDALPILCNVADLDIEHGVATPKVFVLNTRDSTIWIDGTVSLRDETLDLRAVVSPKDFSPMSLRTPIHVKGTFAQPKVSLELGKLAGKAGAAGLLALLHPLAALIPFIDPGAQKDAKESDAECANLARTLGAIPRPVRTPKSAPVPPASASAAAAHRAPGARATTAASAPAR